MSTRRPAIRRPVALAALAVALAWPVLQATALPFVRKGPWRKGDVVTISGQVTDAAGRTLGGVTVLLEVSHRSFRLKTFSRETSDTLRVPATADAGGSYLHEWRWDPYYNVFALAVALPVRQGGRDTYEIFHRFEITDRMTQGGPVQVPLVLPDAAAYDALRSFLDSLVSDDEKRVYREMGRPDRIDAGQTHYDPDRSWWYFAAGKVYRFRDGELEQVVPFEPIEPVEPAAEE